MIALIDIDGTIADCSHRLHFIQPTIAAASVNDRVDRLLGTPFTPDWNSFFNAMDDDKPIPSMIKLVKALAKTYDIVYMTGRPVSHREMTLDWLTLHLLPLGSLVMRKVGDHRPDFKVKRELYESYVLPFVGKADIIIEDRDQVVEMWRSLGLTCLQPCKGSY